ncbi:tRNA (adenine(22)-N(1))-methyltransferase [Gemelliphila palaticanis]|uniref:tRNA (Adenine(22)-N(1))-methyltransferase TrmK n=1 Tax=Gemelliphila palaticanis TaxID=81950 RepID=A0ABX2T1V7_9BACL|nr:tRNA (adenine(22)-N(1))-methyltransferase TrmK [Gemella palaticanis]MBF0715499.1 tRNA (adenine(22)-N(1))-methyltransferase TrmK [Gemella palaticanis]NYS47429.1 tRNA (adenine(22)-N(1))-methyltransferase TrmK [Gemella palaticanis]
MFIINDRLKKVGSYVKYKRLADIGSDHAYLPIYLALNNKIDFAIAGEVVEGPHKSSIKNVADNNLSNTIECRKGSGLDVINLSDNIEVITICGMGGKLIADILETGKEKLKNKPQLILQPNVASNLVREKLQSLGYYIDEEDILEEDGHIYEIIVASSGNMELTEDEMQFGLYLPKKNNDVFQKKYNQELDKINYILNQISKSKNIDDKKVEELNQYRDKINNILLKKH